MNNWTRPAAALLAFAFTALPLCCQEDEKKEPDPEVAEKLDVFEDAIRERDFSRDREAVGIVDELLQKHQEGMHPKDEKDVLEAFRKVFRQKPRKPSQPQLYEATVAALGEIGGPYASRILVEIVDRKPFDDEEWLAFRERVYEAIGKTEDERQIDFLVKAATRSPIDGVKRAAGKALRHFEGSDLKIRKDIFKDLLTNYGKIEGDAKSSLDPGDSLVATRKRTLAAIADSWNETLGALSGQSFRTAEEWYKWYNDHKNDPKAWK